MISSTMATITRIMLISDPPLPSDTMVTHSLPLDSSVLENFHVAETFDILIREENNLLCQLTTEEFRLVRRRMIESILATDMAYHMKHLNALKSKLESLDIKGGENVEKLVCSADVNKNFDNQQDVLSWCIHACDVSNPSKPTPVYDNWVKRVFDEFFNQGDMEKKAGLAVSPLCDRNTVDISKSQIGFINFVVMPTYEVLLNVIPEIGPYYEKVKENFAIYEQKIKENANK
jgi:cAMP-specific phosphodiesterase 4